MWHAQHTPDRIWSVTTVTLSDCRVYSVSPSSTKSGHRVKKPDANRGHALPALWFRYAPIPSPPSAAAAAAAAATTLCRRRRICRLCPTSDSALPPRFLPDRAASPPASVGVREQSSQSLPLVHPSQLVKVEVVDAPQRPEDREPELERQHRGEAVSTARHRHDDRPTLLSDDAGLAAVVGPSPPPADRGAVRHLDAPLECIEVSGRHLDASLGCIEVAVRHLDASMVCVDRGAPRRSLILKIIVWCVLDTSWGSNLWGYSM